MSPIAALSMMTKNIGRILAGMNIGDQLLEFHQAPPLARNGLGLASHAPALPYYEHSFLGDDHQ